jgi:nucleolin
LLGREIRLDIAQERGERGERPAFTPQSGNFRSGGDGGDEKKIFVKGFDASLSEDDIKNTLREHFSSCGEIKNVSVPIDRDTGNSKGIAYLEFSEGKEKALELNGSDMGGGFYLVVDEPRPRGDSSGGGGFGRGNGRFGSGGGRGRDGGRGRFGSGGGRGSDRGRGRPSFTPQGKKTTFGDE